MRRMGRVERVPHHDLIPNPKDRREVHNQKTVEQYTPMRVDFGGGNSGRDTKPVNNSESCTNVSHKDTARTQSHLDHLSAEVLSIIAQMFIDPIPNPTPSGLEYLPSGTETPINELKNGFAKYSPVMWADPLLPYELIVMTESSSHNNVPAVEVDVCNKYADLSPALRLSPLGEQVKRISGMVNDLHDLYIFAPHIVGLVPLLTIMDSCDLWTTPSLDEAAIVRLLLLQTLTIDAHQQVYVSSAINQFAINMNVKRTDCKLVWTPAIDTSEKLQIGVATSTSNLYFRTIDEYAALFSGLATDTVQIRDKTESEVDFSDIVFIPVKWAWRGQAWLVPYILSFTTTSWWNHAVTVDVTYSNAVAEKTAGTLMKARFLPRASTVYIPGHYKTICLIIVDSTQQSLQDAQNYPLCRGIEATRQGNFDFAKQIYAYLGRRTDDYVRRMRVTDITQALNRMKEHMCTPMEFRKLHVKTSVLATSKFNGYGCYPNPDPPPRVTGDREADRNNIFGPAQFNAKNDIKVADYVLPDLASLTIADRTNRLLAHQTWRCDPLGYLAYGLVNTSRDASHKPCLYEYRAGCIQYQLGQASSIIRILRVCGIFSQDPDPDKYISREPFDVFNTTIGYGSLIIGLTNWAFVQLGVSIFEHNRLSKTWRLLPDQYLELWPSLTDGFAIRSSEFMDRLVDIEKYKLPLQLELPLVVRGCYCHQVRTYI
uniref:Uncharacterized protein n=1 Tax=Ceratitis capitata TaxID=7213 RepID=W8C1T8_CERCA